MKIIQLNLTLFFGIYFFAGDIVAQNTVACKDSLSAAVPDSIEINTDWSQFLTPDYSSENCTPPEYFGMKIFVPGSTLTDSMPIWDPPPVDEGIFFNLPPYSGKLPELPGSKKDNEKKKEE